MTVTAQIGSFGVALQSAKGTAGTAWKYMKVNTIGLGPDQIINDLPPEVGAQRGIAGGFKGGNRIGGGLNLNTRANYFGYLLKSLAGAVASVTAGSGAAYKHTFSPSETAVWLTARKNVSDLFYEDYRDCRVGNVTLNFPGAGVLTADIGMVGIGITNTEGALSGEIFDSTPVLLDCTGEVLIESVAAKVTRATVAIDNALTNDEFIIGSYELDDVTAMGLTCTYALDIKVQNATLFRKVYMNAGSLWSPVVYQGPVSVTAKSAANISGESIPYSLKVLSSEVELRLYPVALQGNNIVIATLQGVARIPATGSVFTIELVNLTANYNA